LEPQRSSFVSKHPKKTTTMKTKQKIGAAMVAHCAVLAAMTASQAQSTFTKITTGPVVSDAARSFGAAWVDFDNDGDLDLYSGHPNGANLLYRNDGQGVFTKITDGSIVNAGAGSFGASWADVDPNVA